MELHDQFPVSLPQIRMKIVLHFTAFTIYKYDLSVFYLLII